MPLPLGVDALRAALTAWLLPEPLTITELAEGFGGDAWLVEAAGRRYVATLAYATQPAFEAGLLAAERVERHGIPSGAPLRTGTGALSVLVAHPPGSLHPLALLHFVPGDPLDLAAPEAQHLAGGTLGRVQRILHHGGHIPGCEDPLFAYLAADAPAVFAHYPWLRPLLRRALDAVRAFEVATPVTYGVIYGDYLELLRDDATGRIGLIDWGAVGWGPLLFDLALAVDQFRDAGASEAEVLVACYLAEAPVTPEEARGLNRYLALLWARQARYFAWRAVHNVTRRDPTADGNARTLAEMRRRLEWLWGKGT